MINEKESLHARVTQLLESTHCPKHGMEWEACCFTEVVLELHNKTTDLLTTVRKEETEAAIDAIRACSTRDELHPDISITVSEFKERVIGLLGAGLTEK